MTVCFLFGKKPTQQSARFCPAVGQQALLSCGLPFWIYFKIDAFWSEEQVFQMCRSYTQGNNSFFPQCKCIRKQRAAMLCHCKVCFFLSEELIPYYHLNNPKMLQRSSAEFDYFAGFFRFQWVTFCIRQFPNNWKNVISHVSVVCAVCHRPLLFR